MQKHRIRPDPDPQPCQENMSALHTEAIANRLNLKQTKATLAQCEILSFQQEFTMLKQVMREWLGQKMCDHCWITPVAHVCVLPDGVGFWEDG